MQITYQGKQYWISEAGSRPSVYVQLKNRFGVEYERQIKRDSKTYIAVIALTR